MNSSLARAQAADRVYSLVRADIERGRLRPGETLASTRTLQSKLDVSYYAVLRGLDRLEEEGLIFRRQGSGTYVRDPEKPEPAQKRVAILARPQARAGFLEPLYQTILDEIGDKGDIPIERSFQYKDAPDFSACDAAICIPNVRQTQIPLPPNLAVVLVSHVAEHLVPVGGPYDLVTACSRQGAILVGEHLRRVGCRTAAFLGVQDGDPNGAWEFYSRERHDGFEIGWGAPVRESDCLRVRGHTTSAGAGAAGELLARGPLPDAVFAASDDLAMGFCHGLIAHGLKPGRDIRIVGFDGHPPQYDGEPAMTSAAVPLKRLGRMAVQMLRERMKQPGQPSRRVLVEYSLRLGDTA